MRMGRPNKKWKPRRSSSSNVNHGGYSNGNGTPKYSSPTLVVGQISSNIIHSIYGPTLTKIAVKSVEEYADILLKQQQLDQGDLDLDGNLSDGDTPTTNSYRLFSSQSDIDNLTNMLTETSHHFSSQTNFWKVHANAAKFERLLDEKYGRFRPFITNHPQLEAFIKNFQRNYAMGKFSPFRKGDMPFGTSTTIILLFMMHRNGVRFELVLLVALFTLVGLQPWALVGLVTLGKYLIESRMRKRISNMPHTLKVVESYFHHRKSKSNGVIEEEETEEEERLRKYSLLENPVGEKFSPADLTLRDERCDVILLGSGPDVLYTAALLSRAGRKVYVLSPMEDASGCVTFSESGRIMNNKNERSFDLNIPFDINVTNVAHLSKMQSVLAPALCTITDIQGGVRFARIGSQIDGYAHSILSVPGLGCNSVHSSSSDFNGSSMIPIVLNAQGPISLAENCSTLLGDGYPSTDSEGNDDGNSASLGYLKACDQIRSDSGNFYLSKLLTHDSWKQGPFRAGEPMKQANAFREASIRATSSFLNKCLPLNAHIRSLMAAIGMPHENICPDKTSMAAHVTNISALTSEEGLTYPVGGPRALCHALKSVIEQCGGRVISGVSLQELLFEKKVSGSNDITKTELTNQKEQKPKQQIPKPRCKGIRLENGLELNTTKNGAVISFLGHIPTFLHLIPSEVRSSDGVPTGLPAVTERRPLMKILIGIKGTKEDLNLTGADWYRLPNATLPRDELDELTGQVKFGIIGVDHDNGENDEGGERLTQKELKDEEAVDSEINGAAMTSREGRGKRNKKVCGASLSDAPLSSTFTSGVSWMKVSFPSAKDPSWRDRHGATTTCVVTIEADDNFVKMFDTKPKVYSILHRESSSGAREILKDKVLNDLVETFPQLENQIEGIAVVGPIRAGLSHNPARYAINGNRPESPFPGLYVGGSELTVGDSFSGSVVGGWLAANAIMGYSFIDLFYLGKNITSDLRNFLDVPSMKILRNGVIVEDLAVPFRDAAVEKNDDTKTNEIGGLCLAVAESSKEE